MRALVIECVNGIKKFTADVIVDDLENKNTGDRLLRLFGRYDKDEKIGGKFLMNCQ